MMPGSFYRKSRAVEKVEKLCRTATARNNLSDHGNN
jgi:hypothetical protein